MNVADLFVLSSFSEGNPTVMFEALGCGLPFIGTKVGGVPEIITSEDYGIIVPPGDVEALAKAIERGLKKRWNKKKIVGYAQQFTGENIAKQIIKLYKSVMK